MRFKEARLQAVSSRNMYSMHGFDARIGPEFGHVCHSFIVEWNCMPGSADAHAERAISSHSFSAGMVLQILPSVRHVRFQFSFFSSAFINSCGMRTELLEF